MATDARPGLESPLVNAWRQLGGRLSALMSGAQLSNRSTTFIQAQLREVEAALAKVTQLDGQWTASAMPEAYGTSAAAASVSLTDAGVNPGPANLGGIDQRALRALVERISGDLALTRAALIEGLALGDPRRSVGRVLAALDGDNQLVRVDGGKAKVRTPSGRYWDAEAYARMLGRTAIADARRVAFRQRYLSNGIDLVKVVANGTSHEVCRVWESVTLSLTGATPGFPTVDQARAAGLFHPNCRHRYVVDVAELVKNPNQVARTTAVVPEGPLPILGLLAPSSVATGARARTPTTIRRELRAARAPAAPARRRASEDIDPALNFDPGVVDILNQLQAVEDGPLEEKERVAVRSYVGAQFPIINGNLRKGGPAALPVPMQVVSARLDKLVREGPGVPPGVTLYRGAGGTRPENYGNFEMGAEFSDKAFGSWSADRVEAAGFATSKGVLFRLKVQEQGAPAMYVGGREAEFVLPRNSRYRIVDVEDGVAVRLTLQGAPVEQRVVTVELVGKGEG